jgi:hypothetical protein
LTDAIFGEFNDRRQTKKKNQRTEIGGKEEDRKWLPEGLLLVCMFVCQSAHCIANNFASIHCERESVDAFGKVLFVKSIVKF